MAESMSEIMNPSTAPKKDPAFPKAPAEWSQDAARKRASDEGIELTEDHWAVVRSLQEFFARHSDTNRVNTRELHDALDEKLHSKGGIKYAYELFPGGPIAQGGRIAGLEVPPTAVDTSFGSVK
jgi:tRNA 2-thiouridine synthesizing protein E